MVCCCHEIFITKWTEFSLHFSSFGFCLLLFSTMKKFADFCCYQGLELSERRKKMISRKKSERQKNSQIFTDLLTNWSCLKVLLATSLWLNIWASTEAILPLVMLHPATIDSFLSLKAIRPGVLTGVLGVAKLLPVYKILKKSIL